ncbi:MAG TPA: hypothetical protein DCX54_07655 [Flavobacteriales bacterium]|nr:hypothetical protein [Flavobacteriales bacterium]
MSRTNIRTIFLLTACTLTLWSCGGAGGEEAENEDQFTEEDASGLVNEGEKVVYYGTPSLVEVASIMESSGAEFTPELLNDPEASINYSTNNSKALNLGVYGADLAYAAMFKHTQESINYLKTVKGMAEDLGMSGAFETELLATIETNINNRDSLLDLVTDFYWSADAYLQDNDRSNVAALIIAGGWMESMYLACNMSSISPNNGEIKTKIAEQKLILKNLVLFMEDAAKGDQGVIDMNEKLKELQKIYEGIEITQETGVVETQESGGETVIANETTVNVNNTVLMELCAKFGEIRNEIVK